MICRLVAQLLRVDWRAPWTTRAHGGGPMLDEILDQRERTAVMRHVRQEDTASGRPRRIGDYLGPRSVP